MENSDNGKLRRWCIIGVFAVMVMATLWHFIYGWLPCGFLVAISPVNESPWEHAKLFFIPPLIWYIVMYFTVGRRYPNYVFAGAISLVLMPALILLLHVIFSSIIEETLPLDIVNSLVTIAFGMWVTYRLTVSKRKLNGVVFSTASVIIIVGLIILYATLTYHPPVHPLFMDKQTNQYGVPR
jgi:hypothetical protein